MKWWHVALGALVLAVALVVFIIAVVARPYM